MSKHSSRKSRWTQVNAKEYRALFGTVRYHAGAWEGVVRYDLWIDEPPDSVGAWRSHQDVVAGRFKRPRNAMMAVEEQALQLQRAHQKRIRIAFAC
jgi:hypothetical protein